MLPVRRVGEFVIRLKIYRLDGVVGAGAQVLDDDMCRRGCIPVARGICSWFELLFWRVDGKCSQVAESEKALQCRSIVVPWLVLGCFGAAAVHWVIIKDPISSCVFPMSIVKLGCD